MQDNVTKLKMVLPVGKKKAWKLIATPSGIASWFAAKCRGNGSKDGTLTFDWPDREPETFHVNYVGEKRSSFRMEWRDGAELRYYLHGRLTVLTFEVHYPNSAKGRKAQRKELPQWGFFLANLKSVALDSLDLRSMDPRRERNLGFID